MITVFADTDCDVTKDNCEALGVKIISMPYFLGDKEIRPSEDDNPYDPHEFYEKLRQGLTPKTSGLSPATYIAYFEPELQKGNDVLYIHFSSGMSGTFNAMEIAIEELKTKYPERKIVTFDTLGISILGLSIVKEMTDKLKQGASLEETIKYGEEEKKHTACYFFANDLLFFKRSGRLSGMNAIVGTLFGVKPIIVMNDEGKMAVIGKEAGRPNAIKHLVNTVKKLGDDIKNHPFYVIGSDCAKFQDELCAALKKEFGEDLNIIQGSLNPTAGCHCGPSSLGVAFHAIHR